MPTSHLRARRSACALVTLLATAAAPDLSAQTTPVVTGEQRVNHVVTLTFDGPAGTSETATTNPFTDYRFDCTFTRNGRSLVVPGYYAADGDAAESGAESGTAWRVHFVPDEVGDWTWTASFVTGPRISVRPMAAGTGLSFDGASGTLQILANDKPADDPRSHGMLLYDNHRYLHYRDSGRPFLEIGPNSPENLLAYADIDNTSDRGGRVANFLHTFGPHVVDFARLGGGPTWRGGLGQGLLGALNYLEEQGQNSIYVLLLTAYADGDDVWPWRAANDPWRFDCSKLDQWGRVFEHATARGLHMQLTFTETENEVFFEVFERVSGFADSRKLYFREMIARFGHNLALSWNLGEENGWNDWSRGPYRYATTEAQRRAFSAWIRDLDPYDHAIVVHTYHGPKVGEDLEGVFGPLLDPTNLCTTMEGGSLQGPYDTVVSVRALSADRSRSNHAEVRHWVDRSEQSGRPWSIGSHEQLLARIGTPPDGSPDDPNHDRIRRDVLWGTLMAGGQGAQYYFGENRGTAPQGDDLTAESFRPWEDLWRQSRLAHRLLLDEIDIDPMRCRDELVSDPMAFCLAEPGEQYVVYLRNAGAVTLDLGAEPNHYEVLWWDPFRGGALQVGSVQHVAGPGVQSLGMPNAPATEDRVALVRRIDQADGSGCRGAAFPRVLAPLRLGASVDLSVPAGPQGTASLLGVGVALAAPLTLPTSVVCAPAIDCRLLVDAPGLFPVGPTWSLPVPDDASLLGVVLIVQPGYADSGAGCITLGGALQLPFVR